MRRGEIKGKVDAYSNHPKFRNLFMRLGTHTYPLIELQLLTTKIFSGTTPTAKGDAYTDELTGVPFIRSGEITDDGTVEQGQALFIKEEIHEGLMRRSQLQENDLLIAIVGATIGSIGLYNRPSSANINQAIAGVRLDSRRVIPEYLLWYMMTSIGQTMLDFLKRPVARANINLEEVGKIQVLVPPLSVQQHLLNEIEVARAQREQKLKQADELLAGLDAYLLEQLGIGETQAASRRAFGVRLKQLRGKRIDSLAYSLEGSKQDKATLETKSLQDVAHINANKAAKPKESSEGVPYVGLPECSLTQVREVTIRPYSEVKGRQVIRQGDILFARIEPSVFNRKYVLVDDLKGFDYAYTSTEFYVVRAREGIVEQDFLYEMFFCSFVFEQVKGKTTGSSGRRRISPGLFAELQIPMPNIELQRSIIHETRQRRSEARALQASATQEWDAAKARFEQQLLGDT